MTTKTILFYSIFALLYYYYYLKSLRFSKDDSVSVCVHLCLYPPVWPIYQPLTDKNICRDSMNEMHTVLPNSPPAIEFLISFLLLMDCEFFRCLLAKSQWAVMCLHRDKWLLFVQSNQKGLISGMLNWCVSFFRGTSFTKELWISVKVSAHFEWSSSSLNTTCCTRPQLFTIKPTLSFMWFNLLSFCPFDITQTPEDTTAYIMHPQSNVRPMRPLCVIKAPQIHPFMLRTKAVTDKKNKISLEDISQYHHHRFMWMDWKPLNVIYFQIKLSK